MVSRCPPFVPRRSALAAIGPVSLVRALPEVLADTGRLLDHWAAQARDVPDPELRRQALASLCAKRFHCEGGSVFALAAGPVRMPTLRFIVALQTICDYLDNLCDRSPAAGGPDFRQLHQAMRDAVRAPGGGVSPDYYRLHPLRADGGYLRRLVAACQREVAALPGPSREVFARHAAVLAGWYSDLQELKHLPLGREEAVRRWAEGLAAREAPGLAWWETAAATGSTLGLFALFAAAAGGRLDGQAAQSLVRAYFPWVATLHILLDYWIDRDEDLRGGDLNFTLYYASAGDAARRLRVLGRRALTAVSTLPNAAFHRMVVCGLPALYLTDPKVSAQRLGHHAWRILRAAGPSAWTLYWAVRWMRARGELRPTGP